MNLAEQMQAQIAFNKALPLIQMQLSNNSIMKEIHFYKDLKDCDLVNFVERDEYHVSYNSTKRAIKENEKLIHTTAISALDFSWLLDKGYKIYLHENGKVGEVYEGVTELTDKELRKGHDIRKIWIGGGFEDYFYGKDM